MTALGLARYRDAIRTSVRRLRTIDHGVPIDPAGVADAVALELDGLLKDSLSIVYRPAVATEDWVVGARGPRAQFIRERLAPTVTASAHWYLYDPLRPAIDQRNLVCTTERAALPCDTRSFFDHLGAGIGQTRVLVCDGPLLLAWIGILRPPERRHDIDRDVLRRIGMAARGRLRLSLRIPSSLSAASFEASLDHYPGEAYLLRGDGRIEYANALGASQLARRKGEVAGGLGAALARYPIQEGSFELHPLRCASMGRHFLATRRTGTPDLTARLRDARARWNLTPRQADVLRHLAAGDANKDIAARLSMSVRTVEQHVAAICRRAKVDSRLRLVARVWTD